MFDADAKNSIGLSEYPLLIKPVIVEGGQ